MYRSLILSHAQALSSAALKAYFSPTLFARAYPITLGAAALRFPQVLLGYCTSSRSSLTQIFPVDGTPFWSLVPCLLAFQKSWYQAQVSLAGLRSDPC